MLRVGAFYPFQGVPPPPTYLCLFMPSSAALTHHAPFRFCQIASRDRSICLESWQSSKRCQRVLNQTIFWLWKSNKQMRLKIRYLVKMSKRSVTHSWLLTPGLVNPGQPGLCSALQRCPWRQVVVWPRVTNRKANPVLKNTLSWSWVCQALLGA